MISQDILSLIAAVQHALQQVQNHAVQHSQPLAQLQATHAVSLAELNQALQQFCDILQRAQADAKSVNLDAEEVSQLGAQGLQLMYVLDEWCKTLKLEQQAPQAAILMLTAWMGRNQGQVEALETIVNCLAEFANHTQDTALLGALCAIIPDIMAVAPEYIKQDLEKMNLGRPWRLLHINYAIIATRSHEPVLMDTAFQTLVTHFPQEAKAFFTEGMRQMEVIGYPQQVREVMQRYYTLCTSPSTLH